MNRKQNLFALGAAFVAALSLAGCKSDEDNPITPDKMNEIRAKEAADRGNFKPDASGKPPAPANRDPRANPPGSGASPSTGG